MNKSLRKIHLQIWITIAFLLPVGMISAWLVMPHRVNVRLLQPPLTEALPVLLKTDQQKFPLIAIRANADRSVLQLEYRNTTELASPSALIYQVGDSSQGIEEGNLVGRIDMRGTYHFPLKENPASIHFHFIVYDIIHHQIIQRINL